MNDEPAPTEIEIKIPVADLEGLRPRLAASGAERLHAPEREVNVVLDTATRDLNGTGRVLRLRRMGDRQVLTLKGPASFRGSIKEREEYELRVSDLETLEALFERIGFSAVFRYEKDRESWLLEGVTVALDHTPMGDFVEIEGPAERLHAVAALIGVDANDAVRGSYVSLWIDYRERRPELDLPEHMLFQE